MASNAREVIMIPVSLDGDTWLMQARSLWAETGFLESLTSINPEPPQQLYSFASLEVGSLGAVKALGENHGAECKVSGRGDGSDRHR